MANGRVPNTWARFFTQIAILLGANPFPVTSYTLATLPPAADNAGCMVYVSNATGGGVMCYSRGTANWLRIDTNAIVS